MPARPSRGELIGLGAILALLLAIYLPGLSNELLYDDEYLSSTLFAEYASPFVVKPRMFSYGSFVWVQALVGDGWWKQRLVNLAIHAGTVVALWALYREILRHVALPPPEPGVEGQALPYEQSPALAIAVGFFALNPVAVYAVAYLIQRSILLATFFVVLGLWLFARALCERKPALHVAAVACYALAVMSKEHAILAPVAAIPLYIFLSRPSARRVAALTVGGLVLVGAVAAVLAVRYGYILGKAFDEFSYAYLAQLARLDPGAEKNAFSLSVLNEAYLFFHYGLRWMLPYEGWLSINLRPPFPLSWTTFPQLLGLPAYVLAIIGGFYLVIRYRTWPALLGLSLLFPALLFPTELTTVWVQDPFVLYRSYLWAIGIPGLVFFLFHGPPPRVMAIVGVVLAALLGSQALERVLSLATPEKVWSDAIAKLPKDPRSVGRWFPYVNRGSAYAEHDRYDLALRDFEMAEALGDTGIGAANMGSILSAAGKHAQALAALDRAEKQGYDLYNLPFQRGLAHMALGNPVEAYRQFQGARAMMPPSPTRELVLLHIGRLGLQLQKRDEAIAALEELLALEPLNKDARQLLAMGYVMRQDYPRARALLDRLLEEEGSRRAYYYRALANYGLKRKAEALSDIENAIRAGPEDPHLREWQAKIQALP